MCFMSIILHWKGEKIVLNISFKGIEIDIDTQKIQFLSIKETHIFTDQLYHQLLTLLIQSFRSFGEWPVKFYQELLTRRKHFSEFPKIILLVVAPSSVLLLPTQSNGFIFTKLYNWIIYKLNEICSNNNSPYVIHHSTSQT